MCNGSCGYFEDRFGKCGQDPRSRDLRRLWKWAARSHLDFCCLHQHGLAGRSRELIIERWVRYKNLLDGVCPPKVLIECDCWWKDFRRGGFQSTDINGDLWCWWQTVYWSITDILWYSLGLLTVSPEMQILFSGCSGLAENRPSVLRGDRVVLRMIQPDGKPDTKHVSMTIGRSLTSSACQWSYISDSINKFVYFSIVYWIFLFKMVNTDIGVVIAPSFLYAILLSFDYSDARRIWQSNSWLNFFNWQSWIRALIFLDSLGHWLK